VSASYRLSRYVVIFSVVWMTALTWRLYPQFKDTLRIDGRLSTLADYVEDACGQRVGPAAVSCLKEAQETGRRLVAQEQGKSVLLIEAPVFGYFLIYFPIHLIIGLVGGRAAKTGKEAPAG